MAKAAKTVTRGRAKMSVNKAQLVREAFEKLGIDASAKEIQAACNAHGVTIAPAQISNIRTKLKVGNTGRKSSKAGVGGAVTAQELIQVRILADKVGGVVRARELLDILYRLR